ncbi:MAG: hypothetical protein ACI9CE_003977, partial [Flavobacterium sp.]
GKDLVKPIWRNLIWFRNERYGVHEGPYFIFGLKKDCHNRY